jgi:hypothetical protein
VCGVCFQQCRQLGLKWLKEFEKHDADQIRRRCSGIRPDLPMRAPILVLTCPTMQSSHYSRHDLLRQRTPRVDGWIVLALRYRVSIDQIHEISRFGSIGRLVLSAIIIPSWVFELECEDFRYLLKGVYPLTNAQDLHSWIWKEWHSR